jgi:hypothetical protein
LVTDTELFSNAQWLCGNIGYGALPIPGRFDSRITELLRCWEGLIELERNSATGRLSNDQKRTLLAYGERMASLAVRDSNAKLIYFGLLAVGIGWLDDWRENVLVISLHYDAASRIGAVPEEIFEDAAGLLRVKPADTLRGFLRRSSEDKSLAAMGYVAGSDSDGFRYQRTW